MTTYRQTDVKRRWAFSISSAKSGIYIILLCIVIVLLATKGIRDEGTVSLQGDMPRYLMNGVYFYDLIRDFPITHPMQYTYQYFARYPALSLGHHPPLLSLAEVPSYAVFGISVFSGRLTILCFMLLAGIVWFLLIKSIYTEEIALFSSLLFITTPFIVRYSRIVLSEIPGLAFIIVTTYFFHQYCRTSKTPYIFAFAAALFLSILARYQAVLMIPIFLCYFLIIKKPKKFFTKKFLLTCLLLVLLILPLILIVQKSSYENIRWVMREGFSSRIAFSNLTYHLKAIWKYHLTLPVLILSLGAMCVSLYRRDKRTLLFFLWIGGYYLQITLIGATKAPRYSIYWVPVFCLFVATIVDFFHSRPWKVLLSTLLVLIAGYQFMIALHLEPDYAVGYEQAAKYVVEHWKGESVLFSAKVDSGYFVFFVRKHDPQQNVIVLRADKLLVTSHLAWFTEKRITTRGQIYEILQNFGVRYVVIEDLEFWWKNPLEWLREEVTSDDRFILHKSILIRSNRHRLKDVELAIYEYKDYTPHKPGTTLHMNIPLMGDSIEVSFDDLLQHNTAPE